MPTEGFSLPLYWMNLQCQQVEEARWTMFDHQVHHAKWTPWRAWGPSGYTPAKLSQLVKQSIDPPAIEQCKQRLDRARNDCGRSSDVYTVSLHFGRHSAQKIISPLRYKLGECLSLVVFRVFKGQVESPLVVWRTTELTRRLIADFVLLDNLFRWLEIPQKQLWVDMVFCSRWLANFNCQILGELCPRIKRLAKPSWEHLFEPKLISPRYRARAIAWGIAKKTVPMFNGWQLRDDHLKSDFPKVDMYGQME
jgi:hypothetical protein